MGGGEATQVVQAAPVSVEAAKPKGLDPAFVRKQLMTFVKDVMATDDELELDSPFMEAGMDSLSSVSLMSMVAKEFQMALSPSLVFDFPTVRALEDHLVLGWIFHRTQCGLEHRMLGQYKQSVVVGKKK